MTLPNLKWEVKLMATIVILVDIMVCIGIPYLVMVIWHGARISLPPEPMYLLSMLTIIVFFVVKMMALFYMNDDVKRVAKEYWQKRSRFL